MMQLSATSLAAIDTAARRAARRFVGAPVPITLAIDVQLGAHGAVRGATLGEGGLLYELDRLDASTIAEAMVDAAGVARSGPRAWRRIG